MRFRRTPLAWRSITHDKKRFVLSLSGILFAVVLMFTQLGFLNAVFDSQVELLRRLNADLLITNRSKRNITFEEPFARRRLEQVKGVPGVAAAYPLYIDGTAAYWKNPSTGQQQLIRALGVDPDAPTLLDPEFAALAPGLKKEDTALMDVRSKAFLGPREPGVRTELAGNRIRIIGNFSMGTDFDYDGTIVLGESSFLKIFSGHQTSDSRTGSVELGLVRLQPGTALPEVRRAMEKALPDDVRVWTKQEFIDNEIHFWLVYTPLGFVFGTGLVVGFIVGVVICSQILYTGVIDRMPLFGTLKAIGYTNGYLIRLVIGEAVLLSLLAFVPGGLIAARLYAFLESVIGFRMFLTAGRVVLVLAMTAGMSMAAALIALRKALSADPAEVFK